MPVNVFLTTTDNTLLVSLSRGLFLFNTETEKWQEWLSIEQDHPENRVNDGGVDSTGRMWLGTMENNMMLDGTPIDIGKKGSLYSISSDKKIIRQDSGIGISNTLAFSPDNTVL
jgi:xylono-1,5-lactonase